MIHEIDVDISGLNTFDDVIAIKDLKIPTTIEIVGHEPEDVVALVTAPKVEEEPVGAPAAEAGVEGATPAEGAAPAEGEKTEEETK